MAPITEVVTIRAGIMAIPTIMPTDQLVQLIILRTTAGQACLMEIIIIPITLHLMIAQVGATHHPVTLAAADPGAVPAAAVVVV